jgi:uncharacterized membrane protein YkoI
MFDRHAMLMTVAACLAASHAVRADPFGRYVINIAERENHEQARRAFQQGQIRSLSAIMEQLRSELGGEVIEVELKTRGGIHYYNFKVLAPNGRIGELSVNATDGRIIERE